MGSDKLKTYLLTFGLSGWFAGIVTIVSAFQDMGIILNFNVALMSIIGLVVSFIIGFFVTITNPDSQISKRNIILVSGLAGLTVVIASFLGVWFNNLAI